MDDSRADNSKVVRYLIPLTTNDTIACYDDDEQPIPGYVVQVGEYLEWFTEDIKVAKNVTEEWEDSESKERDDSESKEWPKIENVLPPLKVMQ